MDIGFSDWVLMLAMDILVAGVVTREKAKPPSLLALCLGVIGKHLEDIIVDLGEIAVNFPADIKVVWKMVFR